MTALAQNTSVTVAVKDGGTITIATNGGFGSASVTATEGGTTTYSFGPDPTRRVLGPFKEGASAVITNLSSGAFDYDVETTFDPANASFTGPTLFVNGSAAAPGIAFAANTNAGFRNNVGIPIGVSQGIDVFAIDQQYGLRMAGKPVVFESSILSGTFLTGLYPDAANTLALRNGTTAQTFNLYGTYTDASNYERGVIGVNALGIGGGNFVIGNTFAGTGAARDIYLQSANRFVFQTNGANNRWVMDNVNGTLAPINDVAMDVGASGTRVRTLFAAQINAATKAGAFVAGDIAAGTFMVGRDTVGATTKLYYNNGGVLMSVALA